MKKSRESLPTCESDNEEMTRRNVNTFEDNQSILEEQLANCNTEGYLEQFFGQRTVGET